MRTTPLPLALALLFVLAVTPLSAQEEQPPPPSGTIVVEQKSDIAAVGTWTLLQPNHESFYRTDAALTLTSMAPGRYTFLTAAPQGTSTHIDIFLGDEIIASSETPQISFELLATMTVRVRATYTLAIYGKVGVNSEPAGMPFTLAGPDKLSKDGVTPAEFPKMPFGNYSVTFRPDGCPWPPVQSGLLDKDGRADFSIKLVCKTFRPVEAAEDPGHVTTTFGNQTFTFTDVPAASWYGPYVATVVKRGVMSGYIDERGASTGSFGPADPVTVAQLAKIAHTVVKLDEKEIATAPKNPLAAGQWFTRYIASAEERGWLVYVDGTVDPHRPATRSEVVATLLQVFDVPVHWTSGAMFTDVARSTRYASEVETAAREGIVSGSANADGSPTGLFHPEDPITRAEMAKVLITVHEKYQTSSSSRAP